MEHAALPSEFAELLGEGSMARVYGLRDDPNRVVKLARDPRFNESLLREARLSSELSHSAILPVEDYGLSEEGLAWVLLPRLSSRNLSDHDLGLHDALEALSPIADALDRLHHLGWIHGDVKPGNILAGAEGALYLSDLGLAARANENREGGSPAYLSPSRIAGNPPVPADDRHAFAVTVFEILTGRLPFLETEGDRLLRAIVSASTHSFQSLNPGHPLELDTLFEDAFRGDSLHRGLVAWINDLREALGLKPAHATLFYRSPSYPRGEVLARLRDWLSRSVEGDSSLGSAVLLRGGGRRESELMRRCLGDDLFDWVDLQGDDARSWIAEQETSRSSNRAPKVLLASSNELDEERIAYLSHRPDTLLLDAEGWRIEALDGFLESGLFSAADSAIHLGHEETRFLLEASGGDLYLAEDALAFLCAQEILKAEREQARFVEPFASWESRWRNRFQHPGLSRTARRLLDVLASLGAPLTREECGEVLGMGMASLDPVIEELRGSDGIALSEEDGLVQLRLHNDRGLAGFALNEDLFPKLWSRSNGKWEVRLRILLQAARQGARGWIESLHGDEIRVLGDEVSLSALAGFVGEMASLECSGDMKALSCMEKLRRGELPEALSRFWSCESELSLSVSAELNRRLFHSLQNEFSVEEGFAFLERWRKVRASELAGSELEIRILAREAISHGQFGSFETAMQLIEEGRARFAGRDGLFLLDWAEAEVHGERRDHKAEVAALTRAYESVPEDASTRDRFSLSIQLASHWLQSDDPERGRIYLDRSAALVAESGDPELDSFLTVRRAILEKRKGNIKEEIRLRLLAFRQVREAGLWRVPIVNLANPLYALVRIADYSRLMPLYHEIERHVEVADQVSSAMLGRAALARIDLERGDVDACLRRLDENLELAEDTDSKTTRIRSLLMRGYLHRLYDLPERAESDFLRVQRDYLEFIQSGDFVDLRLELLQLRGPDEDLEFEEEMELDSILSATKDWKNELLNFEAHIAHVGLRRRRGDLEGAEAALVSALDRIDPELYPTKRWPLHLEQGRILMARGDRPAAKRAAGRALEILEGLSRRFPDSSDGRLYLTRPDRMKVLELYRSLD